MVELEGIVQSGVGEGAYFVGLAWVRMGVRELIGIEPYAGTLNVRLADAGMLGRWREIRQRPGLLLKPPPTAPCGGQLFSVVVGDVPAAVVVPDVTRYGDDLLEVIAAVHLRTRLGLRDGDMVTLSLSGT